MRLTDALRAARAECRVRVTPEMTASLNGAEIHPVYSTFWLAYHAECAARLVIEPFFEAGDNAIGAELSLRHEAMAPVGAVVRVGARVTDVQERMDEMIGREIVHRVVCAVEAFCEAASGEYRIASGSQTQIILPQHRIDTLLHQAQAKQEATPHLG
jgi:predicted thioesterase